MFGDIQPPNSRWRRIRARATLVLFPITLYLVLRPGHWESKSTSPIFGSRSAADAIVYTWFFLFGPIVVSILMEEIIRRKVAEREGMELPFFSQFGLWTTGVRTKTYLAIGVATALCLETAHQIITGVAGH